MKFMFEDRNDSTGLPTEPVEFNSLEEFVHWSVEIQLERFRFVPPGGVISYGKYRPDINETSDWLVYSESGYD